ncbi:multidrug resistance efflux pump [Pyrinomonas methylaliphatogenes]|uniref:Multidrug resistance efflux pump n=2 Tax=Pyrinomonas methylaliphatogenes TaxID=454194 RepID=A0A0B6WTN1_9BACT|nr:multidrug resistance efflux pump [Pyrinomonas methylaliphatogenes]
MVIKDRFMRNLSRRTVILLISLALLLVAGFFVWLPLLRSPRATEEVIALSGRIEADEAAVAAKTPGRVREITVREGDQVKAGQVIAILDDDQLSAREHQAEAAVEQAEARRRSAERQIAVLQDQLRQSEISVSQARADAQGRVRQAEAQVAAAQSQLAQAEAAYELARYDAERLIKLAHSGDVSERTAQQARSNAELQAAAVLAARKQVEAARGALEAARANLFNPPIRSAQVDALEQQIAQAREEIAAAEAEAKRARAQLEEARANRRDLQIVAPFDGTVVARVAEPGEVVVAGTTIITLVNLSEVYLRGFVPQSEIGRVRVGQPARVYLDSTPNQPIEAYVARVDPEASFTPENVYFRNERVRQVFGVRLQLKGAFGFAKPGMTAEGEILVSR